jgi:intracellular multiplication protein IcmE
VTENPATNDGPNRLKASFSKLRTVLLIVVCAVVIIFLLWHFFRGQSAQPPQAAEFTPPDMKSPAGGTNHSKKIDALATKRDEQASKAAHLAGKSYTSALSGQDMPDPDGVAAEIGDTPNVGDRPAQPATPVPVPADKPAPAPTPPPAAPAASFTAQAPRPPAARFTAEQEEAPPERPQLSERAQMELIAAWSGGPRVSLEVPGEERSHGGESGGGFQTATASPATFMPAPAATAAASGASSEPAPQIATSARGTLLLPAGRGVYGHSVLTVNSDLGNVVLAQIDSGPFRGARISGTFEMKSERLVIKFNKLMIGDADPIPVSGYAVSPKTAEVGVASVVREHLATRIILPAAAAFVEGLGNAMMNSNTTNYSNGSGMSSFTHLNLGEQMGAAAGTMGQQVGQLIQKNTPQQATVILKQNDGIGILFDEPVYRP